MGAQSLGSRAIIGEFFLRLEQDVGAAWISLISMMFNSDQESETYKWLNEVPQLREWIGGRHEKGFSDNGLTIINKHYEATLKILVKDMRRDKTGQVMIRIGELAERTNSHWAKILSILIVNGESEVCYDGQFFFDTDHPTTPGNTQSNDISVDISELPALVNGVVTAPSVEEAQQSIMKGIAQILSMIDSEGEPMNENATSFLVMVPISLLITFQHALAMPSGTNVSEIKKPANMTITVVANARLSSWTDQFAVFRTDGGVSALIRQQETEVVLKSQAEGSPYEFNNDAHLHGVDAWRNVGYGRYEKACLVTMT